MDRLKIGDRVKLSPAAGPNAKRRYLATGHVQAFYHGLNGYLEIGVSFQGVDYEPWRDVDAWFHEHELMHTKLSIDKDE